MGKLFLGILATVLTLGAADAEQRPAALNTTKSRRPARELIVQVHHPLGNQLWGEAATFQKGPTPLDEAALFLTDLIGDSPRPVSDGTHGSELRIKPWVSSRASVGVKVELSW